MTNAEQQHFRLSPRVRFRRIDEEGIFVLQESGEVLVVNDTGARIVELLSANNDTASVASEIADLYELDLQSAQRDVHNLVNELIQAKAIESAA